MDTILPKADSRDVSMTKLTPKDFEDMNAAIARLQAEALAKGVPYHFSENGRIKERRPDGSAHEVKGPVRYDCGYDAAPRHLKKKS